MNTVTVDVRDLPGRLAELLALTAAGTEVLLTDGSVTGKLQAGPPQQTRGFIFNMHPGAMVMRDDFDDPIDEDAFLRGDI